MTNLLKKVSQNLHENNLSLASVESCTGGWLAKQITDLAGSSAIFDRGFVTYSNQAKQEMLGVSKQSLDSYGAVSEQVAKEMAKGAIENSTADIAVSITGIAGPSGGTISKPVGTVCFGFVFQTKGAYTSTQVFSGNRDSIRKQAVDYALNGINKLIDAN